MRRIATILAFAAVILPLFAELDPAVRHWLDNLPKSVYSQDRLVEVVGRDLPSDDEIGFRRPILHFASDYVNQLKTTFRLTLPRREAPLMVVHIMDGRTNDVRVVSKVERRGREELVRIYLASPGYSDLEEFRFQMTRAYFRGITSSDDLPDWFVQGASRITQADVADEDIRTVLDIWRSARLPFFPALCTDLRRARGKAAALCSYVVAWVKERKLMEVVLDDLAKGKAWDGKRLASILGESDEPDIQDRASDERLLKLSDRVLTPGKASYSDIIRFRSCLFAYPPYFDQAFPGCCRGGCVPYSELAGALGTNELVRAKVAVMLRELPMRALGRGDELGKSAALWMRYLAVATDGDRSKYSESEILDLLDKAEASIPAAGK